MKEGNLILIISDFLNYFKYWTIFYFLFSNNFIPSTWAECLPHYLTLYQSILFIKLKYFKLKKKYILCNISQFGTVLNMLQLYNKISMHKEYTIVLLTCLATLFIEELKMLQLGWHFLFYMSLESKISFFLLFLICFSHYTVAMLWKHLKEFLAGWIEPMTFSKPYIYSISYFYWTAKLQGHKHTNTGCQAVERSKHRQKDNNNDFELPC